MLQKILIVLTCWLIVACNSGPSTAPITALGDSIDQNQLLTLQASDEFFLLLDVRSKEEYDDGHIPDSTHIAYTELVDNLDHIAVYKNKNIVVYCRSGRRANIAIETLKANGFKHVHHLSGDMQGWQESQRPVE